MQKALRVSTASILAASSFFVPSCNQTVQNNGKTLDDSDIAKSAVRSYGLGQSETKSDHITGYLIYTVNKDTFTKSYAEKTQ